MDCDSASGAQQAACGRPEGECCHPIHQAAEAFAREREAADAVPAVVAFVTNSPGCSARAVYLGVAGLPRQKVLAALALAEREGLLRRELAGPRLHRLWAVDQPIPPCTHPTRRCRPEPPPRCPPAPLRRPSQVWLSCHASRRSLCSPAGRLT